MAPSTSVDQQGSSPPVPLAAQAHGSAMLRRFGPLFHLLGLGFLLRRLRFEDHSAEHIRRAAAQGPVVYVMYQRSFLDWLALNVALNARRLPLAAWSLGIRSTPFRPLSQAIRAAGRRLRRPNLRSGSGPPPSLAAVLARGGNAAVYLVRRRASRQSRDPDVLNALVEAQQALDRPLQLVPVVAIWDRSPPAARTQRWRALLGDEAWPNALNKLRCTLTRGSDAVVQAGEPLALSTFLDRYRDAPQSRTTRILRVMLRRYLYREQQVVRGPRIRSRRWMRRLVLESPAIRALEQEQAEATGQSPERVRKRIEATFDHIAARLSFTVMRFADWFTRQLWNRIYSGVDIREEDVDRVRSALRTGTPILVPCHRSHLDYVLISSIFWLHDVMIPHVVAGINLSFWPAGPLLRRLGAVFIKRSFKGDRLFQVVFTRYLQQLIREGYPVEFFIEGGRSRTGKLLPPRVGVLGMVMDAAALISKPDFDVTFLPMNISYERIAEESAYVREIRGERKSRESFRDLLKARRIFRHRFGRVYLRVGRPLSARAFFESLDFTWADAPPSTRRDLLHRLGRSLLHRVNREAVVLPTALVALSVLAHDRRGIRASELQARVERFQAFLERAGCDQGASLHHSRHAVELAVHQFVEYRWLTVHQDDKGPIYGVSPEHRVRLEYYKNTLLAFFTPGSLLAVVLRSTSRPEQDSASHGNRELFARLLRLFRIEFILDPDRSADELFEQARLDLTAHGALEPPSADDPPPSPAADPAPAIRDHRLLEEFAALTLNFVESYWLAIEGAYRLRDRPLDGRARVAAIREMGEGLYAVEELRHTESVSSINIRNAMRVFEEDGLFRRLEDGRLAFEGTASRELADMLRALCR